MAGSIERLLVATQKGLFTVERPGGKWALRDAAFEGEEISAVLADARDGAV
jgi:ligand-binding sensor domain-containing protein